MYHLGQSTNLSLKDLADPCCHEGAATLLLTAMWNAILMFESDAKRFKRVISTLGQAEVDMMSQKGTFMKTLGEFQHLSNMHLLSNFIRNIFINSSLQLHTQISPILSTANT